MNRLYVLLEGQTEFEFARHVLTPHFHAREIDARLFIVETSRDAFGRKRRGGGSWSKWLRDLQRISRTENSNTVRISTMFDLYGLPRDFPGLDHHQAEPNTARRAELLEHAMAAAVGDWRLIPYLQRHEFEALVLASLPQLKSLLDAEADTIGLARLEKALGGIPPEDVNDGPTTAPSKRLEDAIPSYRKTVHGPLALEATGLAGLRSQCPRFDAWLARLETPIT